MTVLHCLFCKNEVIGLTGQEHVLDTVFLQQPEDHEVTDAGIYGYCHKLCLINSKWGSLWAKRWIENYNQTRRFPIIGNSGNVTFLRYDRAKPLNSIIAIADNGSLIDVRDKHLPKKIKLKNGYLIPQIENLNINLSTLPNLAEEINSTLFKGGSYSLKSLIEQMGLSNYLIYPKAIEDGRLTMNREHKKALKQNPSSYRKSVWSKLEYAIFVPQDIMDFTLTYLNK